MNSQGRYLKGEEYFDKLNSPQGHREMPWETKPTELATLSKLGIRIYSHIKSWGISDSPPCIF